MLRAEADVIPACDWCGLTGTGRRCAVCAALVPAWIFTDPVLGREVHLARIASSNIDSAGWIAVGASGVAVLCFTNGSIYRYERVPRGWWISFLAAESKGRHLAMTLKPDPERFPCVRVGAQEHSVMKQ